MATVSASQRFLIPFVGWTGDAVRYDDGYDFTAGADHDTVARHRREDVAWTNA